MSILKSSKDAPHSDKKSSIAISPSVTVSENPESESKEPLHTLAEVAEPSEIFEQPQEIGEYEEISPRIFGLKDVREPLTIPSLNNAIYELGIVNLCWPKIFDPVFETRKCFPKNYYTNSNKERLLLAYCENFRRQFLFHHKFRKPLLLQCPNECGLQKMVCTSLRPTKLCFADTNHWKGVAQLVSDYFVYEPLTKPMLHVAVSLALRVVWKGWLRMVIAILNPCAVILFTLCSVLHKCRETVNDNIRFSLCF